MELNFYHVPEFESDLEEISKRYRNISEDLENFKKVLNARAPHNIFHGAERMTYLGDGIKIPVYKFKHFRSRDLKGKGARSGFRVIYTYDGDTDTITLIEIYMKTNTKQHPDLTRIHKYCT
jgi:mRNA-degrading endonuclease RelE of RelBE toxin-antitoxin system